MRRAQSPAGATCAYPRESASGRSRRRWCGSCGRPSAGEGAIGVVAGSRRGEGRSREDRASGEHLDRVVGRRNRGGGGGANRLWEVGVAGVENPSAQIHGRTVDRSLGCWMGARLCKDWGTAPRSMAAVLARGGSLIGRELRSVSRNCLTFGFGAPAVEEKHRLSLFC